MSEPTTFGALVAAGHLELGDGYRTKRSEHGQPGLPILRVAEVLDGKISPTYGDHVSNAFRRAMGPKVSRAGDVVLTTKGTVGRVALVADHLPEFVYSPQLCYFRILPGSPLSARYLYYWFRSDFFWSQAGSRKSQTDMADYINLADIRSLQVHLPAPATQQAIVDVLGALDDKIAVNERTCGTASELAAALFSHRFESGELTQVRLEELAEVVDCLHSKKPIHVDGSPYRYLILGDIREDGRLEPDASYSISRTDYEVWTRRVEVRGGDCVITNVGRVGAVGQVPEGVRAAIGRNMTAVRGRPGVPPAYLIEALRCSTVRREIEAKTDHGTILSALNVRSIPRLLLPAGDRTSLQRFQGEVGPLHRMHDSLLQENTRLERVRDSLLPGLMSGAVHVRDAEKVVEDAV